MLQAADEPAYLTVGTDVSAKYRGAFCEAKIKTVKRMVKVKVSSPADRYPWLERAQVVVSWFLTWDQLHVHIVSVLEDDVQGRESISASHPAVSC